jgi:hypothetical protein
VSVKGSLDNATSRRGRQFLPEVHAYSLHLMQGWSKH